MNLTDLIIYALAVGAATTAVTKGSIFEDFRQCVAAFNKTAGTLVSCSFCLSAWVSLVATLTACESGVSVLWFGKHVLAIWGLSNIIMAGINYSFLTSDALDGEDE